MPSPRRVRPTGSAAIGLLLALGLAGCATQPPEPTLAEARAHWPGDALVLRSDDAARSAARTAADALLAAPLQGPDAVRLALLQSAALQAMLAEAWSRDLKAQASARPASLHLAWERMTHGGGVELTRTLGLNLGDWLLWPLRQPRADAASQAIRLELAAQTVALRHAVQQQWVRAVAAEELLRYHAQARSAMEAAAELARRMQSVGHFSRLQRARHQAQEAAAVAAQIAAAEATVRERESLVRLLGLDAAQAVRLQLPDRLPALPAVPRPAQEVAAAAGRPGLAYAASDAAARAAGRPPLGLSTAPGLELSLQRIREGSERARASEIGLDLPLRSAEGPWQARALAARFQREQAAVQAESQLREAYASYRSAHQLAQHLREVLVPLRQTIQDEVLLNYNGMLASPFDLLGEARAQVLSVIAAIEAGRDFWLADAALQAAIDGVALAPPSRGTAAAAHAEPAGGSPGH